MHTTIIYNSSYKVLIAENLAIKIPVEEPENNVSHPQ